MALMGSTFPSTALLQPSNQDTVHHLLLTDRQPDLARDATNCEIDTRIDWNLQRKRNPTIGWRRRRYGGVMGLWAFCLFKVKTGFLLLLKWCRLGQVNVKRGSELPMLLYWLNVWSDSLKALFLIPFFFFFVNTRYCCPPPLWISLLLHSPLKG